MAEVLFYHLERATTESVLPNLLEKTLLRGWRAVIRVGDNAAKEALDAHLWVYADESFLPHGVTDPDQQPVFLTTDDPPSGFDVLFLAAGGVLPASAFSEYARTVVMFDQSGAPTARDLWKEVKAAGLDGTYWRQSGSGKWEKAA